MEKNIKKFSRNRPKTCFFNLPITRHPSTVNRHPSTVNRQNKKIHKTKNVDPRGFFLKSKRGVSDEGLALENLDSFVIPSSTFLYIGVCWQGWHVVFFHKISYKTPILRIQKKNYPNTNGKDLKIVTEIEKTKLFDFFLFYFLSIS